MIEIEKKFLANKQQLALIAKEASFIKEVKLIDTYYDTSDYKLTLKDEWLRKRNDKFELKVGIKTKDVTTDHYEELTDDKAIMHYLNLYGSNLSFALEEAAIVPFCVFNTIRKKYKLANCYVDIDETDFGDHVYRLVELEILVKTKKDIKKATSILEEIARKFTLTNPALSKLTVYLSMKRPLHYKALHDAGIL
jgi:adenylate cyclase class IV